MTTSQVLLRRYSDVDINNLLAHFVDTLLDVEQELEAASDWQWDTIVRDACRSRRQEFDRNARDQLALDSPVDDSSADPDTYVVRFARPRDPK